MGNRSASDSALGRAAFAPLAGVRIADFSTNMAGPYVEIRRRLAEGIPGQTGVESGRDLLGNRRTSGM